MGMVVLIQQRLLLPWHPWLEAMLAGSSSSRDCCCLVTPGLVGFGTVGMARYEAAHSLHPFMAGENTCSEITWPRLDFKMGNPTFIEPNHAKYRSMDLSYAAGRAGGTMTGVLSAANEKAVELFLDEMYVPGSTGRRLFEPLVSQPQQAISKHSGRN